MQAYLNGVLPRGDHVDGLDRVDKMDRLKNPVQCLRASPIKKGKPFPYPLGLGWPHGLLWPIASSGRDTGWFQSQGLGKTGSFCFHTLGIWRLPHFKKLSLALLKDEATVERKRPHGGWKPIPFTQLKPQTHRQSHPRCPNMDCNHLH